LPEDYRSRREPLTCFGISRISPSKDITMKISSPSLRNTNSTDHSDFSAKLCELRTLLGELAKSAPSAASETFDDLKSKASALCDSCEEKVTDATHAVAKTVKQYPTQVALAAVGAGLIAWWLLSRNANKED
jgi:ElaB/YqjD/DUF883 family membrane-anchored ribosome-binding protein